MRTHGNNIPFNGSDHDQYSNTAEYYVDGFSVATLDFETDTFEDLADITEYEKDFYYSEMVKEKEDFEYQESMMTTSYN